MDQNIINQLTNLIVELHAVVEKLNAPRKPSRDEIAMHIMAGSQDLANDPELEADWAVQCADALLAELNK